MYKNYFCREIMRPPSSEAPVQVNHLNLNPALFSVKRKVLQMVEMANSQLTPIYAGGDRKFSAAAG